VLRFDTRCGTLQPFDIVVRVELGMGVGLPKTVFALSTLLVVTPRTAGRGILFQCSTPLLCLIH
jgi:hypothetical protein